MLKKIKGIFIILAFIPIFLLSGLRVNVGVDYSSYALWFDDIFTHGTSYFEPGFMAMIEFIQLFTRDPQWLFIASSLLAIGGIFLAIKRQSVYPALSIFLFCTAGFLSHSMNLTRQFIAVAIILYVYHYTVNKRLGRYIIAVVIASLFHKTALIMLPVYFIMHAKLRPIHYIVMTIIAALTTVFQNQITNGLIANFYPQYYNSSFVGETISSKYYLVTSAALALTLILFLARRKLSMEVTKDRVLINTAFLIMLAHTFLTWLPLSNRISLYIDISLIVIIPLLISYATSKLTRIISTVLVLIYFSYVAYLSLLSNANDVLPYRSVLSQHFELKDGRQIERGLA
jgi:hypothetical protein